MDVELFLQYPNISNNELCDGAWHNVTVLKLCQVFDCPWLYIMEYYDKEKDKRCFTVLVQIDGVFYKAALTTYADLFTSVNGILAPVDAGILPAAIELHSVSYDLADLTLKMLVKHYATSRCVSSPPPPPPPPPKGPSYGNKDGQRLKYAIKVNANNGGSGDKNGPDLPVKGERILMSQESTCRIATLFIQDFVIYWGMLTPQGLIVTRPSRDELIYVLSNYYVIWRSFDYHLVLDSRVIVGALDKFRACCYEEGMDVSIREVYSWSNEALQAGYLPAWLSGIAHRYLVFCQRAKSQH